MYRYTIIILFLAIFQPSAYADGYWLELKGSHKANDTLHILIRYGGVGDSSFRYLKTGRQLDKLAGFRLSVLDPEGHDIPLPISQTNDAWTASYIPAKSGVYRILAIHDHLPVVVRPDSTHNILPIQYLCSIYTVGPSPKPHSVPHPFLDILTTRKDKRIDITAFINQSLAPENTKLRIFNPDNWEKLPLTDTNGQASFYPTINGLYIIRIDYEDKHPGSSNGKNYSAIRHRFDYSLQIDDTPLP